MNLKQQTINTYNSGARVFIEEFNNIGARVADIDKAFTYIERQNPFVVELGCGNGRDAKEILKRTSNYLGIDLAQELLTEAKKNNPQGNFQLADLETFQFPQNVDIIFAFASLLHSNREVVQEVLNQASSALQKDGVFFISLKHDSYHEETKSEATGSRIYYYYTPEDITNLAPEKLINVFQDFQEIRNQKWFTIILQKKY